MLRNYNELKINVVNTMLEKLEARISRTANRIIEDIFCGKNCGDNETLLERIGNFNGSLGSLKGNFLPVNVYPGGIKTNDVYNEFICICGGTTKLGSALKSIVNYCRSAEIYLPIEENKKVVFFTNQWSEKVFSRYKLELEDFCTGENVDIYMFLVTDYGVSEIPYLFISGQNHYSSKMHFFAGMNSKYEQLIKLLGEKIIANELMVNLKNNKIYSNNICICDYIPRDMLLDFIFDLQTIQEADTVSDKYPDIDGNCDREYSLCNEKYTIIEDLITKLSNIGALKEIE